MAGLRKVLVHQATQPVLELRDCNNVFQIKRAIQDAGHMDTDNQLLVAKTGSVEHPAYQLLDDDDEQLDRLYLLAEDSTLDVALYRNNPIHPPTWLLIRREIETASFRPQITQRHESDERRSDINVLQLKESIDVSIGLPPPRQILHILDFPFPGVGNVRVPIKDNQLLGNILRFGVEEHRIGIKCLKRRRGSKVPVQVIARNLSDTEPQSPETFEFDVKTDTVSTLKLEIELRELIKGYSFAVYFEDSELDHNQAATLHDCGIKAKSIINAYQRPE